MVTVRLLGPVDVLDDDGNRHAPRTPLRRTLISALALAAGRVVEADRLLEQVWNGDPPASGRRTLRFHLSRLRREVAIDDLIVTVSGGYRVDADVDSAEIEEAVAHIATNDPDHRVELARTLLGRWRGEPMVDAAPCDLIDHERLRLTELRLALTEQLYSGLVETGEATTSISELIGLCLDHPLRERLWSSLIIAQYRAGLQADALRSYDRLRRNLVEQLGVDPSPPLRELEQHILQHSPALLSSPGNADPARGNLAGRAPELIGRTGEEALTIEVLHRYGVATITGVGGVGKTSLARAVAHRLGATMEPWWVELAPVTDDGDVVASIAAAIQISAPAPTLPDVARVLQRRGPTLLVLDNCEHLASSVSEIIDSLVGIADLRVLATSRVPIASRHEQIVRLGPFERCGDAAALFVREARRRDPSFACANGRDEVINAICNRVDRIPLAIELAAARAQSLGLGDIFDQLSALLDTPSRSTTGDDRHRTMTGAIRWSTDLLDPDVARGLGVLTVLAGTFDLRAAAALLDIVTDRPAFDVIDELVAHSLIEPIRIGTDLRYRVLEPVRQFAAAELLVDERAARDRHLEHFLGTLEAAYRALGTNSCAPILGMLQHDLDNLQAVHDHALASGRIDDDLRLYRPLMISDAHAVFAPGAWALETVTLAGIDEHERSSDALAKALQTSSFKSAWTLDEGSIELLERLRQCEGGPGGDLVEAMLAWIDCTRERRRAEGLTRWDAIETDDTFVTYLRHLIAIPLRARGADDPLTYARAEFERAIAWARSIGAQNLEAAMRTVSVTVELRWGDAQSAHDRAVVAVELTTATGMRFMRTLAVLLRSRAILEGARSAHDPLVDLRGAIAAAIATDQRLGLSQVLDVAAQLLHGSGRTDAAAVASMGGGMGMTRSWSRSGELPDGAIARAARFVEGEHLDVVDIGERTLAELDRLIAERTGGHGFAVT